MFVETTNGTFVNLMKCSSIAPGSNQNPEDLKNGAEFIDSSICGWTISSSDSKERGLSLLEANKSDDPMLYEWANFNIRQALQKRHFFFSMKDVVVMWATQKQACIERMNAETKTAVPANMGASMGPRQPSPQPGKQDKALYRAIEHFMSEIGIDQKSSLWSHFTSNKAMGFDKLAALILPILMESKEISQWEMLDSFRAEKENPTIPSAYAMNSSILKMREAWKTMQLSYPKPDIMADEVVSAIKNNDMSQQEEPSIMSAEAERELAMV